MNRKTVNEYIQSFQSTTSDFAALSQLKEKGLMDLLPQGPVVSKPEAYHILQSLIPSYKKALKKPVFTYLNLWESYRNNYPQGYRYPQFKEHLQKGDQFPYGTNRKGKAAGRLRG